jgi:hypothetical protein
MGWLDNARSRLRGRLTQAPAVRATVADTPGGGAVRHPARGAAAAFVAARSRAVWAPEANTVRWLVAARDTAIDRHELGAATYLTAQAREAITAATAAGASKDELAGWVAYPGGGPALDGDHIDALLQPNAVSSELWAVTAARVAVAALDAWTDSEAVEVRVNPDGRWAIRAPGDDSWTVARRNPLQPPLLANDSWVTGPWWREVDQTELAATRGIGVNAEDAATQQWLNRIRDALRQLPEGAITPQQLATVGLTGVEFDAVAEASMDAAAREWAEQQAVESNQRDGMEQQWRSLCWTEYDISLREYGNDGHPANDLDTSRLATLAEDLATGLSVELGISPAELRRIASDAADAHGRDPGADTDPDRFAPPDWARARQQAEAGDEQQLKPDMPVGQVRTDDARLNADHGPGATAGVSSAASVRAEQLQRSYYAAMDYENAPLVVHDEDGNLTYSDDFPDSNDSVYRERDLLEHLQAHPELASDPQWAGQFDGLDEAVARVNADIARVGAKASWTRAADAVDEAVGWRDMALHRHDLPRAAHFTAQAREAIADALATGASLDELAAEVHYPGGGGALDGDHIDALLQPIDGSAEPRAVAGARAAIADLKPDLDPETVEVRVNQDGRWGICAPGEVWTVSARNPLSPPHQVNDHWVTGPGWREVDKAELVATTSGPSPVRPAAVAEAGAVRALDTAIDQGDQPATAQLTQLARDAIGTAVHAGVDMPALAPEMDSPGGHALMDHPDLKADSPMHRSKSPTAAGSVAPARTGPPGTGVTGVVQPVPGLTRPRGPARDGLRR